jgi:protein phosphatase
MIAAPAIAEPPPSAPALIAGRYKIEAAIGERGQVQRFSGSDLGAGTGPIPVTIVRQPADRVPNTPVDQPISSVDTAALSRVETVEFNPNWPGVDWEKLVLARAANLSLPRIIESISEDGFDYLILEVPEGRPLWNAWDEAGDSWPIRCTWLFQLAEALHSLHAAGAFLSGLRPDIVVVTPTGQAAIADVRGLLPLPLPKDVSVPANWYAAPELISRELPVDARVDLYSFGATLQALLLGHELTDLDFDADGYPKPHAERFPDTHPLLTRLLARTFAAHPLARFPSWDRRQTDPTGFLELMEAVAACALGLTTVRLDIAAWTSTGALRSNNEDAVALLLNRECRLEESDDFAVMVLADGMGGAASGEVAAAMTVRSVREYFFTHPPFAELLGTAARCADHGPADHKPAVIEALHEANRRVFEAWKTTNPQAGMGCTAEVIVIDGGQATIGHVGDSRVYHCHSGKLAQITHDHTLVNHLVLLGQVSAADAASHPQRSELQQAIGGRNGIFPDAHTLTLHTGDWLLVCSDGLSNQLSSEEILDVLLSADSAEKAARRLVNRALIQGAADNVSAVVVRAC